MDPITMSLIMGVSQAGVGALQKRSANRRRERAMADMRYDIPSAVTEQVQSARERASQTGLPGEDVTRARLDSQLAQTTARGESVSEGTSDVLGLYAKLYGQRSDANMQLLERGAQYKDMNEMELNKSLGLMAEAEGQQFYYNKYLPFLSDMQYASEESQGGAMNIASGLQTAYSGWMNKWQMDEMQKMYGMDDESKQMDKIDFETRMARNRLDRNSNMWLNKTPMPDENALKTPLSPWVDPQDRAQVGDGGVNTPSSVGGRSSFGVPQKRDWWNATTPNSSYGPYKDVEPYQPNPYENYKTPWGY